MSQDLTPEIRDGHQVRMAFLEHLRELRDRGLRAFIAIMIGTIIGFFFSAQALEFLQGPFCEIAGEINEVTGELDGCSFQTLNPTDNIIIFFRVALLIGGILSIPLVTYQVMAFIIPGLTKKEKRIVFMSIPAITILFLVGVWFSWVILIPPALTFLNGFLPDLFNPEWTADGYLSFTTSLIFWMGVAFETPLVFFVLSVVGVVTPQTLMKNWRLAVVGASIAAAMITPTIDPVNMFLVMGPLLALYGMSILLTFVGVRINRGEANRG
ncbi:MAG: twin-arginine translocase subunit TatC [Chloroflexota bacterium]